MSTMVKSKLLFLSANLIAFFVFLQMGFYILHSYWGLNAKGEVFQYCLIALKNNTIEHQIAELLFEGLIVYTILHMIVRLFKQAYFTWKVEKKILAQKHIDATRRLNQQYYSLETEIIVVHDDSPLALAMGIVRPKILISTNILYRFTEKELQAILLHEWHHCKKRDPLKTFLLTLYTDSMKYVPILNGLVHSYKVGRELVADLFVIKSMGSAYELGNVLLNLAGQAKQQPRVGVSFADVGINYRIQQIIEPTHSLRIPVLNRKQTIISVVVISFLFSLLLGGCA